MSHFEPHPSVVCTVLDDGGVLLHLDTKYYYSVNSTGMAFWTLLESGSADPASDLSSRYPSEGEAASSIQAFLDELTREQLVQRSDTLPASLGEPVIPQSSAWSAPRLTRHAVPLNQILSNPFDPSVPLAE